MTTPSAEADGFLLEASESLQKLMLYPSRKSCGAIGGVIFGTITDYPAPYEMAICNDCKWQGKPNELLSDSWENYRYCPICGSDDTEIRDMVYDDTVNEYKVAQ